MALDVEVLHPLQGVDTTLVALPMTLYNPLPIVLQCACKAPPPTNSNAGGILKILDGGGKMEVGLSLTRFAENLGRSLVIVFPSTRSEHRGEEAPGAHPRNHIKRIFGQIKAANYLAACQSSATRSCSKKLQNCWQNGDPLSHLPFLIGAPQHAPNVGVTMSKCARGLLNSSIC